MTELSAQEKEIIGGMIHWEPGTLSTSALNRIMVDVLSDVWQDCFRRGAPDYQQYQLFREKVASALYAATGINMQVVKG